MSGHAEVLPRIHEALEAASEILQRYTPGAVEFQDKGGGDPVTEADHEVDAALKELLPAGDDGWLSEETADDASRLEKRRVWVVDPLDGGFVLARFGCPVGTGDPSCDTADQNGDGVVDPLDSGFVLARFGECL